MNNANVPSGINLYKWEKEEEEEEAYDYKPTPYQTEDKLITAVKEAKGDDLNEADKELVKKAFDRYNDCGNQLYSGNEEGANWTDEICINIYKYYMFDNNAPNRPPEDLDEHIKANLKVNGYHILGNDSVELNEENFVEKLAGLNTNEFKRCMIDISGFMLNQLLLGGIHNYTTLKDVENALREELVNNSNKNEEIKNDILNQFQQKIQQATNQSASNNELSNIVRSNKQRKLLGDDENSTVVSFAANSLELKKALNKNSESPEGTRDLENEIKNAIDYISNDCIEDKILKLNFFNCNIVTTTTPPDDQISLTKLTEELNQVFNSSDVDTSYLKEILIILNGNPGVIPDNNKNINEYLFIDDVIIGIKNAIAGENNSLKSIIEIKMDKFMSVKQLARLYNNTKGGGSKKRSRPNKRVKTKKAKAKVTRKKQNKRLKKNKTLKKKNRRA